jgi:hypothetical protein
MTKDTFDSIEAVRAHYYPNSVGLLRPRSNIKFPKKLSEESLRVIERIAAEAVSGRAVPKSSAVKGSPVHKEEPKRARKAVE